MEADGTGTEIPALELLTILWEMDGEAAQQELPEGKIDAVFMMSD
ncbi:MAG: hypothetical protein ABFD57_00265 [Smithella sp.]